MIIRKTEEKDLQEIDTLYLKAKALMKANGNPQWQGEYPSSLDAKEDMKQGHSYVIEDNGVVVGVACIGVIDDPCYHEIDGAWLNESAYVVIHRITTLAGHHYSHHLFVFAKKMAKEGGVNNVRIDTHVFNALMIHTVEKEGFVYCGVVRMKDNTLRNAYQWVA